MEEEQLQRLQPTTPGAQPPAINTFRFTLAIWSTCMFDANQPRLSSSTSGRAQDGKGDHSSDLAATARPTCQFRPDCTQLMNHFTASLCSLSLSLPVARLATVCGAN